MENKTITNLELSINVIERENCTFFGCNKPLTLQESLCGDKCIDHKNIKKVDPATYIQLPIKGSHDI